MSAILHEKKRGDGVKTLKAGSFYFDKKHQVLLHFADASLLSHKAEEVSIMGSDSSLHIVAGYSPRATGWNDGLKLRGLVEQVDFSELEEVNVEITMTPKK